MTTVKYQEIRHSSATLHEAYGQRGALPSAISALQPEMQVTGRAVTVASAPLDNLWIHRAIYAAAPGDVLVVSVGRAWTAGYWGEVLTRAALARRLAGLVIDGCVRDGAQLATLGLPIFCRGLSIRGTSKIESAPGGINRPTRLGEVLVEPGDLIVGDRDGVVCIAQDDVPEALAAAERREQKEAEIFRQLEDGASTLQIYGWS